MLFHGAINDATTDRHHEVFVSRANQHIQLTLLVRLIQVISDLGTLETICIVDDVKDIVPLAYLSYLDDFVGSAGCEAARRRKDAKNFVTANALNCSIDIIDVSGQGLAFDDGLDH